MEEIYSDEDKIERQNERRQRKNKRKILGQNSKKVQRMMKRFKDEASSDDSDEQEKRQEEREEGQTKTSLKNVFDDILKQDTKGKNKNINSQNPIFNQYQKPLKQIKKELKLEKEAKLRKKIKELKSRRGHVKPSALMGDDLINEKDLKIQAAKGVIKIFEAITNFQKQNL